MTLRPCDVFISFRTKDGDAVSERVVLLHKQLASLRNPIAAWTCATNLGFGKDNPMDSQIATALTECKLFVIMGSKTYGQPSGGSGNMGTDYELRQAVQMQKPIFLIKMCDSYETDLGRQYLSTLIPDAYWMMDGSTSDTSESVEMIGAYIDLKLRHAAEVCFDEVSVSLCLCL